MIIVMPNAFTKYQGSMYSNSAAVGDWETFVARDLVTWVDAHYRTLAKPESRGLAGHSMGGYGTLRIAMKQPGPFSAIHAMSSCCLAPNPNPDLKMFERAAQVRTDQDIGCGVLDQGHAGLGRGLVSGSAQAAAVHRPAAGRRQTGS